MTIFEFHPKNSDFIRPYPTRDYWNRLQIDRDLPLPKPNLPVKFRDIPCWNADGRALTSSVQSDSLNLINYAHNYWNRLQINRALPLSKPNLPVKFRQIPCWSADGRALTSSVQSDFLNLINYAHNYWNPLQIDRALPPPKPNLHVTFREIP